jgi:hypothetical protein
MDSLECILTILSAYETTYPLMLRIERLRMHCRPSLILASVIQGETSKAGHHGTYIGSNGTLSLLFAGRIKELLRL